MKATSSLAFAAAAAHSVAQAQQLSPFSTFVEQYQNKSISHSLASSPSTSSKHNSIDSAAYMATSSATPIANLSTDMSMRASATRCPSDVTVDSFVPTSATTYSGPPAEANNPQVQQLYNMNSTARSGHGLTSVASSVRPVAAAAYPPAVTNPHVQGVTNTTSSLTRRGPTFFASIPSASFPPPSSGNKETAYASSVTSSRPQGASTASLAFHAKSTVDTSSLESVSMPSQPTQPTGMAYPPYPTYSTTPEESAAAQHAPFPFFPHGPPGSMPPAMPSGSAPASFPVGMPPFPFPMPTGSAPDRPLGPPSEIPSVSPLGNPSGSSHPSAPSAEATSGMGMPPFPFPMPHGGGASAFPTPTTMFPSSPLPAVSATLPTWVTTVTLISGTISRYHTTWANAGTGTMFFGSSTMTVVSSAQSVPTTTSDCRSGSMVVGSGTGSSIAVVDVSGTAFLTTTTTKLPYLQATGSGFGFLPTPSNGTHFVSSPPTQPSSPEPSGSSTSEQQQHSSSASRTWEGQGYSLAFVVFGATAFACFT